MSKTGRNVESLVLELSEVRKQLDGLPGQLQEAVSGLLVSVRAELTEHRERFIGVLRAEQSQAAGLRKDNAAQQHRIEELLAELGQARLDLARTAVPVGPPDPPVEAQEESRAQAELAGPEAVDSKDLVRTAPEASEPFPVQDSPTTTTITSAQEPTVNEPIPQPGAEDVPPAVRDYIHQVLAERLHAAAAPQEPAADEPATPQQARAGVPEPRMGAGGTTDLIPPALAWPAHVATLRKASAVNELAIACHPHTWELLCDQVRTTGDDNRNPHFAGPTGPGREQRPGWERGGAETGKQDDNILSGRSTVSLLNALHTTVHQGLDAHRGIETWSIAVTAYERIAEVVNATRPTAAPQDGPDDRPRVVLDDRSANSAS